MGTTSPLQRRWTKLWRGNLVLCERPRAAAEGPRQMLVSLVHLFRNMVTFDYSTMITALTPEQRLHFYELFAHNLTIAIRSIWSNGEAPAADKLQRIMVVNEIMHRVTSKIYVLRLSTHEWTEEDTWNMIEEYAAEDETILAEVNAAIKYSYNSVTRS